MTYRTGVSQKSCRQHNVLGQSSEDFGTVKSRFWATTQSPVVYVGWSLLYFIMMEKLAEAPLIEAGANSAYAFSLL
jgi:uncharacterized membrane protein